MTIGTIGAGKTAQAIAVRLVAAGIDAVISPRLRRSGEIAAFCRWRLLTASNSS
jgi:3-hydroxyisobutyrate dehydrogenase-like beta-hydroxyacid dehydrogenase